MYHYVLSRKLGLRFFLGGPRRLMPPLSTTRSKLSRRFFSAGLVRATTGAPLVAAIFAEQEVEPENEANVGRV